MISLPRPGLSELGPWAKPGPPAALVLLELGHQAVRLLPSVAVSRLESCARDQTAVKPKYLVPYRKFLHLVCKHDVASW